MADAQKTILFDKEVVGIFSHEEQGNFAFDAANSQITRAAGDFNTSYVVGQAFRAAGAAANKKRCHVITAIAQDGLSMTLDKAPADEAAATMTLRVFDPAANITGSSGPDFETPDVEVTHSMSDQAEFLPGKPTPGAYSFDGYAVRDDTGYIALKQLSKGSSSATFLVADSDRKGFLEFLGSVRTLTRTGALGSARSFNCALRINSSDDYIDSDLLA